MQLTKPLDHCVLCDARELETAAALAPMPVCTPGMRVPEPLREDPSVYAAVPLDLLLCGRCGHLQVGEVPDRDFDYRNYAYRTSLSVTLRDHFRAYAADVVDRYTLRAGLLTVEIGSNDGTLLGFFAQHGLRVVGIDPATHIAQAATALGVETIGEFFTAELARTIRREHGAAAVICANNVVANLTDLRDFMLGVTELLADDGIMIIETQYGRDVIERNLLDTVYHEHVSYFFVAPLVPFLARHGLVLVDVQRVDTKGGSIRLAIARRGAARISSGRAEGLIAEEQRAGTRDRAFFQPFVTRNAAIGSQLRTLAAAERARGGIVAGWGVSIGTSTLLAQYDLAGSIDMLFDDDPDKEPFLRGPGYRLPVFPGDALGRQGVSMIIVFAWRYLEFIMERHPQWCAPENRYVVPLPNVRIVDAADTAAARLVRR